MGYFQFVRARTDLIMSGSDRCPASGTRLQVAHVGGTPVRGWIRNSGRRAAALGRVLTQ